MVAAHGWHISTVQIGPIRHSRLTDSQSASKPGPLGYEPLFPDDAIPTVSGIVLFADLPQAILPKRSGIKIYRYKTSDSEGWLVVFHEFLFPQPRLRLGLYIPREYVLTTMIHKTGPPPETGKIGFSSPAQD